MLMFNNKIMSESGESLVETLVAIFIIVLVLSFLSASIATASRLNTRLKETPFGINYDDAQLVSSQSVSIIAGDSVSSTVTDSQILENGKVSVYKVHGNSSATGTSTGDAVFFYYFRDCRDDNNEEQ